MFIEITAYVLMLTICMGKAHPQSLRDAVSSFSFMRDDVPISFNYSAVHIYSTPTPAKDSGNNYHSLNIRQAALEDKLLHMDNFQGLSESMQESSNVHRPYRSNVLESNNYHHIKDGSQLLPNIYHPDESNVNRYSNNPLEAYPFKYHQETSNHNLKEVQFAPNTEDQNRLYSKTAISAGSPNQAPKENLIRKDHLEPRLYADQTPNHKQAYRFVIGHNIAPKQMVRNLEHNTLHDSFPELLENVDSKKVPEKSKEKLRNYIIHQESEHNTVPSQSQLKAVESPVSDDPLLVYVPKQFLGAYGSPFGNTKVNERSEPQRPKVHGIHLNVARFYNIATSGKKASDMKIYSTGLNNVPSAQAIAVPNLSHVVNVPQGKLF